MTTHSSSTTEDTSEIAARVSDALVEAQKKRSATNKDKIAELVGRIRDLESRGFIRRQRFCATTTIEFERKSQRSS